MADEKEKPRHERRYGAKEHEGKREERKDERRGEERHESRERKDREHERDGERRSEREDGKKGSHHERHAEERREMAKRHEQLTSPTHRGKYVREMLLCETIPPPPPGVAPLPQTAPPGSTVRQVMTTHRSAAQCSACHALDGKGVPYGDGRYG